MMRTYGKMEEDDKLAILLALFCMALAVGLLIGNI